MAGVAAPVWYVSPTQINYRANICALKKLGATHVLSVSAVGSMKEETSVRQVVHDMLVELAETKERLDRMFG